MGRFRENYMGWWPLLPKESKGLKITKLERQGEEVTRTQEGCGCRKGPPDRDGILRQSNTSTANSQPGRERARKSQTPSPLLPPSSSCLSLSPFLLKATRSQREREPIDEDDEDAEEGREVGNEIWWQMEEIHLFLWPPHSWHFLGLSVYDWINFSLYFLRVWLSAPLYLMSLLGNNPSLST